MKANELMVNDWVSMNGSNYQVLNIKKKGVINLYEMTPHGEHKIEMNTDWIEEFLKPIPITEEILLKNGMHKDENHFTYSFYKSQDDSYHIIVIFAVETPGYVIRLEVEHIGPTDLSNVTLSGIGGKMLYVHELQHALNQCNIDKDIIL